MDETKICPDCNGSGAGYVFLTFSDSIGKKFQRSFPGPCSKCSGRGYLDWIDLAVGRDEEDL